jgi:hypothetical protein
LRPGDARACGGSRCLDIQAWAWRAADWGRARWQAGGWHWTGSWGRVLDRPGRECWQSQRALDRCINPAHLPGIQLLILPPQEGTVGTLAAAIGIALSDVVIGQKEWCCPSLARGIASPEDAAVQMHDPRLRPGPIWSRNTGLELTSAVELWVPKPSPVALPGAPPQ